MSSRNLRLARLTVFSTFAFCFLHFPFNPASESWLQVWDSFGQVFQWSFFVQILRTRKIAKGYSR